MTDWMTNPPDWCRSGLEELRAEVDKDFEAIDDDDRLRWHPGIPNWALEWARHSPFTITVRQSTEAFA